MPAAAAPGRQAIMEGMNIVIVGTGPVSFATSSRSPATAPRVAVPGRRGRDRRGPQASSTSWPHDTEPHYGVSTGFGALATRHIPRGTARRSCSAPSSARTPPGSGPEVEREVVRAMMLLRLSTLATGRTGVRAGGGAGCYAALLNAGITPVVREYGSLGCSGDLAPLAHCALALMGEGVGARRRTASCGRAAEALAAAGHRARSSSRRRRAWRSSTAPTACSACSCSPSPTCAPCSRSPTSPPR